MNEPGGLCGALTRSGGRCKKKAGHGTDHPGYGTCRNHGGCAPSGKIRAARLAGAALALERSLDPYEALQSTVDDYAAFRDYCRREMAKLDPDDIVVTRQRQRIAHNGDGSSYVEVTNDATLHLWLQTWLKATKELAHLAKLAADAGVEERQVRVLELVGDAFDRLVAAQQAALAPHLSAEGQEAFREATVTTLRMLERPSEVA